MQKYKYTQTVILTPTTPHPHPELKNHDYETTFSMTKYSTRVRLEPISSPVHNCIRFENQLLIGSQYNTNRFIGGVVFKKFLFYS